MRALIIEENNKVLLNILAKNAVEMLESLTSALLAYQGLEVPEDLIDKLKLLHDRSSKLFDRETLVKLEKFVTAVEKKSQDAENLLESLKETFKILRKTVEYLVSEGVVDNRLNKRLNKLIHGSKKYEEFLEYIHIERQSQEELLGEMGIGSKLGNKILNPSLYSKIYVLANDSETVEIMNNNEKISDRIGRIYNEFLDMVEDIRYNRQNAGVTLNDVTNFSAILVLEHRGLTLSDMAENLSRIIEIALSRLSEKRKNEGDQR